MLTSPPPRPPAACQPVLSLSLSRSSIARPELIHGNRSNGVLTAPEVQWLARTHDVVILSGATQDPENKSSCGELRIADAARRLKYGHVNAAFVCCGVHWWGQKRKKQDR